MALIAPILVPDDTFLAFLVSHLCLSLSPSNCTDFWAFPFSPSPTSL